MFVFRIKEIRNNKNISARQLSKETGLSRSYISELENNKKYNLQYQLYFLTEFLLQPGPQAFQCHLLYIRFQEY